MNRLRARHFAVRASAVALSSIIALTLAACGGGGGGGDTGGSGGTGGGVPTPNRAPVASDDITRVDTAALGNINVLGNDNDPDGNPLTVTIDTPPVIGTAAVNTDKTINLGSLPSDFKGVTWFKYKVADPSGLSATATAVIYVGTDPFRVAFVGDASGNGNNELYLANFAAAPVQVSSATEGSLKLAGFQASDNGATFVYRRASNTTMDLSFVQLADRTTQVRIALPSGASLPTRTSDTNSQALPDTDMYRVSPDGQWIAFLVDESSGARSAYAVKVSDPASLKKLGPTTAVFAAKPRFSRNSQTLYGLFADTTGGGNKTLHAVDLASLASVQVSAASGGLNDITDFAVGSDQKYALIRRKRNGLDELDYADVAAKSEAAIYQAPALTTLIYSTLERPPGLGGSVLQDKIAFTTQTVLGVASQYVRVTDAPPGPQAIGSGNNSKVIGFRPSDEKAVLYARGGQIYEKDITPGSVTADVVIGAGNNAWYDSTGNIVLLQQALPYTGLAVVTRGSFNNPTSVGTSGLAAAFFDVSGFDHSVLVLGEGATSGAAPTTARLALINAIAADKLLYLADFQSPLTFGTSPVQVVGPGG